MTPKSNFPCPCSERRPRLWFLSVALITICFAALSARAQQANYDVILSGARIVDGTGAAWHYGDIAIKGDRIAAMGNLQKASADHRIDAHGLVVSPGFIDVQGQSEFNILVGPDGPVIIDLPQVVNAAGNTAALAMLERDVNNVRNTLGRFAPELLETQFAREMWSHFEQGELKADSELTGIFARDDTQVDAQSVLMVIEDAREEAMHRELVAAS